MLGGPADRARLVGERLRGPVRGLLIGVLLVTGLAKFLTYGSKVQFFGSLGLPWPAVLVPLVGATELAAAVLLFDDTATRVAATLTAGIMVVAAATAGPDPRNVGVLLLALGLLGVDTWT